MRRPFRVLAITAILGAVLALAGCEQPIPKVTVQSGSFSTTITPSSYCYDATHCRSIANFDLPDVHATIDGNVLVDVPRDVADTGWSVQALSINGTKSLGGSGVIRDYHSYRVAANANNGNPFIVAISQVRNGKSDQSRWSFVVRISQQT